MERADDLLPDVVDEVKGYQFILKSLTYTTLVRQKTSNGHTQPQ